MRPSFAVVVPFLALIATPCLTSAQLRASGCPGVTQVTCTPAARALESLAAERARGRDLEAHGDREGALTLYRSLAAQFSDMADLQLDLARVAEALDRRDDALAAYRRFVALEPNEPRGRELLGWALAAASRHEEALRSFHESLQLNPTKASVWGAMALSAVQVGRPREAISYWERALIISPDYFDARADERTRWERAIAAEGQQAAAQLAGVAEQIDRASGSEILAPGAPTSSGSGFFVSREGLVLTNKHVVRGCAALRVRADSGQQLRASVLVLDSANDLAILKTDRRSPAVAMFRMGDEPRPGEDIVAVGYPLSGLLADQVNVSTGAINALAGMYNDERVLQMSAPVQPGSSGGPLFDSSGNVVGVVVTKLNAKVVAEAMGDIPQNVNFALKGVVAKSFLDANGVRYEQGAAGPSRSHADIGEIGRRVTVLVECWK